MAGVLVRLKLRVLAHSLHGRRAVLFVLGAIYGLVGGVGSALLPLVVDDVRTATDLVALFVALWALGWVAGPIALGGGDETIRPENFALLPVRPTPLAWGMAAASLVGTAPVATLIAFSAHGWVGLRSGALPAVVGAVGALAELALVLLVSRVVVAALGAVMGSRRGQDLGVVLAALGALAFLPLQLLFTSLAPVLAGGGGLGTLGTVLRALPTGWAAVAVAAAAEGDPLLAVVPLLGLGVLCAGLLVLWGRLLERRLTVAAVSAGPTARATRTGRRTTRPRGPVGAVVARELLLWRRDARRRSLLVTSLLLGLVLPAVSGGGVSGAVAYTALWLAVFATTQLANLYGLDGGSIWHLLVVGDAARADVRGRQIAWLVVVAPVVLLAAVGGPLVATALGSPGSAATAAPWLAGLVPVLLGAGCGLVVLQSVSVPIAQPQGRGANPFGGGGAGAGPGCVRAVSALAFLLLLVPPALPVLALLIAGQVTGLAVLSWAATPVGLGVGVVLARWWGSLAIRRLEARGPEVLAEVGASRT